MPNTYERETRSALHNTQEKINKTRAELEIINDYLEKKEAFAKVENRIIGISTIAGVLAINLLGKYLSNVPFLSNNFSSKIGPFDCLLMLLGVYFLWKSIR